MYILNKNTFILHVYNEISKSICSCIILYNVRVYNYE